MNDLTSLNSKLYDSLAIDELEARLEMGCWDYTCGAEGCGTFCVGYIPGCVGVNVEA